MQELHLIQQLVLVTYAVTCVAIFFQSWRARARVTLGSLATSLVPLVGLLVLITVLEFSVVPHIALMIVGAVLYLAGAVLGKIAFDQLGWTNSDDFWFARHEQKSRSLVTTGIYAWIRHPIFMAIAVSYLGLTLVFFHPVILSLWIAIVIFGVITSLHEEAFMQSQLPEYSLYMKRTGRFLPKLFL